MIIGMVLDPSESPTVCLSVRTVLNFMFDVVDFLSESFKNVCHNVILLSESFIMFLEEVLDLPIKFIVELPN